MRLPVKTFLDFLCLFTASGFGIGYLASLIVLPVRKLKIFSLPARWSGGGFLGSCLGLWFVWTAISFVDLKGLFILVLLTVAAIFICGRAETLMDKKDDSRIILDEVIGFFWAVIFLPLNVLPGTKKITVLLAAFLLFRIFDVSKLPFRKVQNFQGGFGVIIDDVLAGVLTNLILQLAVRFVFY